jgi:riboflavin kinase
MLKILSSHKTHKINYSPENPRGVRVGILGDTGIGRDGRRRTEVPPPKPASIPHSSCKFIAFVPYALPENLEERPLPNMNPTRVKQDWKKLYAQARVFTEPLVLHAHVVHGFKRGSKELGCPTANLNMDELGKSGEELATGIYYGWSRLEGKVYPSVLSVGWNPYYKNEKKTIETHLIQEMEDFYDKELSVMVMGFLRDEANFDSLEDLIDCINSDIEESKRSLSGDPPANESWPSL